MACRAIHSWTLCSLVGAYLDLALAYLLLCGSFIAFLAAKFLAILGLDLPCSCDGLFGRPHPPGTRCLQGLLVHCPTSQITAVRNSVLGRFPFDSILNNRCETTPCCFDVKLVTDSSNSLLEMDELELSRSVSNGRLTLPSPGFELESSSRSRSRSVLRRRRRTFAPRSVPSSRPKLLGSGAQLGISEGCSSTADFTISPEDHLHGNCADSFVEKNVGIVDKDVNVSELSEVEVIKKLEKALEEEQDAYAALCLELEKERSAAASAADEAMAMILRLQEEKAAIEMEARQYRRMSEEKSAYDEEEMEILKEIIVRREREKHVLEGELEFYRQMLVSDEQFQKKLAGDCFDIVPPVEQKQLVDESFCKKENDTLCIDKDWMGHGHSIDRSGLKSECLHPMQVPAVAKLDFGDEGDATTKVCPYSVESQGSAFEGSSSSALVSVPSNVIYKQNGGNADRSCNALTQTESELSIYDVHVIDDRKLVDTGYEKNGKQGDAENILKANDPRTESSGSINTDRPNISSVTRWGAPEGIHRSSSESEMGSQMTDSRPDSTPYKLKSSKSAVESERLRLEIEVELLRKRLKTVQRGREKLSISSSERREKEDFQLQLLEEISSQLREIRKATEPVNGARRASLPPQFSKA